MKSFYHYTSLIEYRRMMGVEPQFAKLPHVSGRKHLPGYMSTGHCMIPWQNVSTGERFGLANNSAIFGCLDSEANEWWQHTHPSTKWPLMATIFECINCRQFEWSGDRSLCEEFLDLDRQIVQLEITVAPEDKVYVADWGVHLFGAKIAANGYASPETLRRYADSLVPFSEYDQSLGYDVPEVVCFSNIPIERIRRCMQDDILMLAQRMYIRHGYEPYTAKEIAENVSTYACANFPHDSLPA